MRVKSFDPIANRSSRLLILGSMPGIASFQAQQYYAHPQNLFWPFMESIFGIGANQSYAQRVRQLLNARIAVWDVLHSCNRKSSLDADIDNASIVPNDFLSLFIQSPQISTVYFNGAKAEQAYNKHVLPLLQDTCALVYHRLPSTSPANASIPYSKKLAAWKEIQKAV